MSRLDKLAIAWADAVLQAALACFPPILLNTYCNVCTTECPIACTVGQQELVIVSPTCNFLHGRVSPNTPATAYMPQCRWMREGRQVTEGQQPTKTVRKRGTKDTTPQAPEAQGEDDDDLVSWLATLPLWPELAACSSASCNMICPDACHPLHAASIRGREPGPFCCHEEILGIASWQVKARLEPEPKFKDSLSGCS